MSWTYAKKETEKAWEKAHKQERAVYKREWKRRKRAEAKAARLKGDE